MAQDVLRAYLISIGFKIDEAEFKKFKDRLQDTDKQIKEFKENFKKLAEVAIGAAGIFATSMVLISNKLEQLYFASQRTGTTAGNFKAFVQAAEQIGVSTDAAGQSIEGMASALRMNPGLVGLLQNMGVNANQDKIKVMLDLVDKLRRMPFYQGARIGQMFGLDPQTLFMYEKNFDELSKNVAKYEELNKQTTEQAEKAHTTAQAIRDFEFRLETLKNTLAEHFLPQANKFLDFLSKIVDYLISADKATDGWSSRILAIGSAVASVLGPLALLRAALGFLGIGGGTAAAGAAAGTAGTTGAVVAGGALATLGLGDMAYTIWKQFHLTPEEQKRHDEAVRQMHKPGGFDPKTGGIRRGLASIVEGTVPFNNPGNLRSWFGAESAERFRNGVSIGNFAKFGSAQEGLQAMAAQLLLYANRDNLNTVTGIISKYAPSSENDTKSYISDVSKRLGVGATSALNLNDPDTLSKLMQAMIHHEQGKDPFNLKTISDAANYRLGQIGNLVSINQKTEVNVNGAGDPQAVAKAVAAEQSRVNGDLVRNIGATVR